MGAIGRRSTGGRGPSRACWPDSASASSYYGQQGRSRREEPTQLTRQFCLTLILVAWGAVALRLCKGSSPPHRQHRRRRRGFCARAPKNTAEGTEFLPVIASNVVS